MTDRIVGTLEYRLLQAVRSLDHATPSAVTQWLVSKGDEPHPIGAVFTSLRRMADKGFVDRSREKMIASGRTHAMDVYKIIRTGMQAVASFDAMVDRFRTPLDG